MDAKSRIFILITLSATKLPYRKGAATHALTNKWDLARDHRQRIGRLDEMVSARTAALSEANGQLQSEIARRAGVEAALRASEERFQTAFQAATMPMAV